MTAAMLAMALGGGPVETAPRIGLKADGTLSIAGRSLRCRGVRTVLDPRLRNLGIAAPGVLVLNPGLLDRYSDAVRLFVFHHECGHHHVGGNELKADCWAVGEGVRHGWLDREALTQVCRSFGNAPATPTHPAATRRCANLEQCFAAAGTKLAGRPRHSKPDAAANATPKLVSGPTLLHNGTVR
jgi:hypothetical protein